MRSKQSMFIVKHKYNLFEKDVENMLLEQNNLCKICQTQFIDNKFTIDHCHITNKVRGLLCLNCNSGMGLLKDNIEIMKAAIKYLNKYK
jgi:hypothetical protein